MPPIVVEILAALGAASTIATVIGHLVPSTKFGQLMLAFGVNVRAALGAVTQGSK